MLHQNTSLWSILSLEQLYFFVIALKMPKEHDWCCYNVYHIQLDHISNVRLDLDMIYEINTKLISMSLLSVFCQVFCYYCRKERKEEKCPLLSFMRIVATTPALPSMEPCDRWNMSFSFFGKPYFCLQHAIIQCYLFTVEIFFKHCEELVFSSVGLTFNCTVMKYLNRELQRVDRVVCFGWGGIPQKEDIASMTREMYIHTAGLLQIVEGGTKCNNGREMSLHI